MAEQVGWQGMLDRLKSEAPRFSHFLPQLPRLVHQALSQASSERNGPLLEALLAEQRRTNFLLSILFSSVGVALLGGLGWLAWVRWGH